MQRSPLEGLRHVVGVIVSASIDSDDESSAADSGNKEALIDAWEEILAALVGGESGEYFSQHAPMDRPNAINLPYDRVTKSMDLSAVEFFDGAPMLTQGKETPIITHCGGGGRGQKAKEYLEKNGFTNVINGGGPSVKEHWELFGSL